MEEDDSTPKIMALGGVLLLLFIILVAILAWITYGTLEGVLGMLSYLIVGIFLIFPWIVPFAGIPLGILDVFGIYGFGMYNIALNFAHLQSTWMPVIWSLFVILISILIQLILNLLVISWIGGLKHRKKEPKKNLALINCNIIDGNKDSKVINDGVILIKNLVEENEISGLIIDVGKANVIDIPVDYKKIDLKSKYVLPGLINAHCHLIGDGKPRKMTNLSDKTLKRLYKILKTPIGKLIVIKMMKANVINALNGGVTSLRTMGDPLYLDVKLRKKIEKGKFTGPRLIVAGQSICVTGGHGGILSYIADSIPEMRKRIRNNLREEVDCIKIISTGGVMDARKLGEAGRPQMTIEEIEAACFEAHRGNVLVASHVESTEGLREALKGGVDTIEHGAPITDDLVPLFKNNPKSLKGYTALIPTLSAGMGLSTLPYKVTKITPIKYENARLTEKGEIQGFQRAYSEGIRVGVGTDAGVSYSTHYDVWKELRYFMKYTDMAAQEAIFLATKGNAEILGIDNLTGSIEVGKSADLQVVNGNPLENIDALGEVIKVIIQGNLIDKPKVKKVKNLQEIEAMEI
jgi:imidazolonepropionase-like amidohydrolase